MLRFFKFGILALIVLFLLPLIGSAQTPTPPTAEQCIGSDTEEAGNVCAFSSTEIINREICQAKSANLDNITCQFLIEPFFGSHQCYPSLHETQCRQYCFVEIDGLTNSTRCYKTQQQCIDGLNSEEGDEAPESGDVVAGSCGLDYGRLEVLHAPLFVDEPNTTTTPQECQEISNNCEGEGNKGRCLATTYPAGRADGETLCAFVNDRLFGFDMCVIQPSHECSNYCYYTQERRNRQKCFDTRAECLQAIAGIDPKKLSPNYCGINNPRSKLGLEGDINLGTGIDSGFNSDSFRPFQPLYGLYHGDSLPRFTNTLLQFLIGVSGVIVVIMIVSAGLKYVISAAGTEKTDAKVMIQNSLTGLVLLIGSVALLNTINPNLLNLKQIKPIEIEVNESEFRDFGSNASTHLPYCFKDGDSELVCRSNENTCTEASNECANDNNCQVTEPCQLGPASELASQILTSPNISWPDQRYKNQIIAYSNNNFDCYVDPVVLQLVYGLSVNNTFSVTSINRYCTGVLTASGESSYHYRDGGGRAVDFGFVNGQNDFDTPAGRAVAKDIFTEALNYLPDGSGFGQSTCGINFTPPTGYRYFSDPCDHLHFQVPLN